MQTHSRRCSWLVLLGAVLTIQGFSGPAEELVLQTRRRVETSAGTGDFRAVEETVRWEANRTALVLCDMWDRHWCRGATARVAEMASRMNQVVQAARRRGALIVHCPSDTMRFYADTPQRRLAQDAPPVTPPVPLQGWCGLDRSREAPLPIDDSDGGCDDEPQCGQGSPWKRQIATLEIAPGDAITDSAEAYYLLRQRGIDRVIVLGVHLNMCVLGRPFAIRQLVKQGLQVLLVRDLTDTMYNSRRAPRVSHFAGTELMIAHVEKYWCPTITSADFVGGPAFRFQADRRPRTVFLIGEDEYRTWETLPIFAAQELETRGLPCAIVQQDPRDKNRFPGLHEALSDADLLLVSVRRRSPPRAQLDAIRAHLAAGKALVGIRTASHAFAVRANDPPDPGSDLAQWPGFDPEVLGGNYQGHHPAGPITTLAVAPGAADNPILQGIGIREFTSPSSLYRASPLAPEAGLLLLGSIPGKPAEPVAWTHCYGPRGARVFYTSLGGPDDFANPVFRRLLLNGILWAANQPITSEPSPTNRAGR